MALVRNANTFHFCLRLSSTVTFAFCLSFFRPIWDLPAPRRRLLAFLFLRPFRPLLCGVAYLFSLWFLVRFALGFRLSGLLIRLLSTGLFLRLLLKLTL